MPEVELGWDQGEENLAARMHVEVELFIAGFLDLLPSCLQTLCEKILPVI